MLAETVYQDTIRESFGSDDVQVPSEPEDSVAISPVKNFIVLEKMREEEKVVYQQVVQKNSVKINKNSFGSSPSESFEDSLENQKKVKRALGMPDNHVEKLDFERQLLEIFQERASDVRKGTIGLIISNMLYQLQALKEIDTTRELVVQSLYWILVIISSILTALSFRKGRLMLSKYGFCILTIRNVLRIYNFEESELSYVINVSQQVLCVFMIQNFSIYYQNNAQNRKLQFIISIFWCVGQTKAAGQMSFQNLLGLVSTFLYIILQYIIIGTVVRILSRIIGQYMEESQKNYDLQDELNQIIQNLEESIIIMSDFRAEYINQKFLQDFSKLLSVKIPSDIQMQEPDPEEQPSRLQRLKSFLRCQKKPEIKIEKQQEDPEAIPDVMKIPLFNIYKAYIGGTLVSRSNISDAYELKQSYSFEQIVKQYQNHSLQNVVFYFDSNGDESGQVYFQIKLSKFIRKDRQKIMFQFIKITKTILYDIEKANNMVLSMINACVSHEMRNPLNSILAQNLEKSGIYQELEETIKDLKSGKHTKQEFLVKHDQIMKQLYGGLKIMKSSANVLTFIVQDLLDYAQIKSGKFRKNIHEFNIIEAIEEVMLIQQRKAQDNNVRFHVTFENIKNDGNQRYVDHKHQDDEFNYMINTDQQRVMQVLLGLQSNALKFTQDGEVHIQVKVLTKEDDNYLQVTVQDTGIGISEKNQEKLFQFFGFLSESQKMNSNGVGLGLVISKQIVEQFEGDIKLESEVGVGSAFTFTFKIYPLEDEIEPDEEQIVQRSQFRCNSKKLVFKWKPPGMPSKPVEYLVKSEEKDKKTVVFQNMDVLKIETALGIPKSSREFHQRILIVDDQSFNIDALLIILKYSVGLDTAKYCETSLSGAETIKKIKKDIESQQQGQQQSKYSLILMDCNMPNMDGLETTQQIREYLHAIGSAQPIISAITGHVEQMYVDRAIESGMNQVLSKPVIPHFLDDLIKFMGFPVSKQRI